MGVQFDQDPLAVAQNNYITKIVNAYIVYDLDGSPRNLINNFRSKNNLFGSINIVKSSDKKVYRSHGRTFDGVGSWDFGKDFARYLLIFGVGNSFSSHTDNRKNNFLVLRGGDTFGINGSFGASEKQSVLALLKQSKILL